MKKPKAIRIGCLECQQEFDTTAEAVIETVLAGKNVVCQNAECKRKKLPANKRRPVENTHHFEEIKRLFEIVPYIGPTEIARRAGVTLRASQHIIACLRKNPDYRPRKRSRVQWKEIADYSLSHSPEEAMEKFGVDRHYYKLKQRDGTLPKVALPLPSRKRTFIEKLALKEQLPHGQLRRAMLSLEVAYKCTGCGNDGRWNGYVLTLHVHHKDGDHNNNNIKNLEFLCPNCHWVTENHGGRNKRRYANP